MRTRYFLLFLILVGSLSFNACVSPSATPASDGRLRILATTNLIADAVQRVGGEDVHLETLLPPDTDPHAYTVTPQDVKQIASADILFLNGLGLELSFQPALDNARSDALVVDLSQGLAPLSGDFLPPESPGDEPHQEGRASSEGRFDPHVWTDPNNVIHWVDVIAETLAQRDPSHADAYRQRAEAYTQELQALDAWVSAQVDKIPAQERILVSDHAVWGHFAARYGFEQQLALIPGYSTLAQSSAQELAALEDAIQQYDVPVIFVGNTVNPALAERVAADTGKQLVFLYTDSLSAADGPAPTYLDWMRYNVNAIVNGLMP